MLQHNLDIGKYLGTTSQETLETLLNDTLPQNPKFRNTKEVPTITMDSDPEAMDIIQEIYVSLKDLILTITAKPWQEIRRIQKEKMTKIEVKTWLQNDTKIQATAATAEVLNSCAASQPPEKEEMSTLVNSMVDLAIKKKLKTMQKNSLGGRRSPAPEPSGNGKSVKQKSKTSRKNSQSK